MEKQMSSCLVSFYIHIYHIHAHTMLICKKDMLFGKLRLRIQLNMEEKLGVREKRYRLLNWLNC